jgi:hypothetical protein
MAFQIIYPQLDGVKIKDNRELPWSLIQGIRKSYDYLTENATAISALQTGLIQYGPHTTRPASSSALNASLYIETDRNDVIYQSQGSIWQYLAGTMYGTLTPDERPTDLGVNDAGFDFRAIDTDANSGREFQWSQTEWIETTPIRYGTRAQRLATPILSLLSGSIWMETDFNNEIYQVQIIGGVYTWVQVVRSGDVQYVSANNDLTLTTVPTDVPGATLTLARAGRYFITGVFDFVLNGPGDTTGIILQGRLNANGVNQPSVATLSLVIPSGTGVQEQATVSQQWVITAAAPGEIAKLQGSKTGGTGTSFISGAYTTIAALWVSP